MVLGLSFGRKSRKSKDGGPALHTSPSLPTLHTLGIPWPENLVDKSAVEAARKEESPSLKTKGGIAAAFHKPFKAASGETATLGTIASLFTNKPAANLSRQVALNHSRSVRKRVAPTLNVMTVGSRGTGKTSLLRLFLETSEISSTATPEQRQSVNTFLANFKKSTKALQTTCIEISESRYDKVLLSLIDTPGLNFDEGAELALERSVSDLVKYLDLQYDETMGEESKVERQSKGDQHVHLCIYLIDPTSIIPARARKVRNTGLHRKRSQTTISAARRDDDSDVEYLDGIDETDERHLRLSMNPAELKVIKRLAARVNVLPVIARSDELIDARLEAIKRTVKRDLASIGLGFSVFAPPPPASHSPTNPTSRQISIAAESAASDADGDEKEEEEEERSARPVIRIRHRATVSERSRSRRRSKTFDESPLPDPAEAELPPLPDNAAQTNGHLGLASKSAIESLLPFALVSPQPSAHSLTSEALSPSESPAPGTPNTKRSSMPPSAFTSHVAPSYSEYDPPREYPKGKFIRKYRWGVLDVLDPQHSDFIPMRTAILSTFFKALKVSTREVLYEKYRTDKLLARRATQNISEDDRKRLLLELGL